MKRRLIALALVLMIAVAGGWAFVNRDAGQAATADQRLGLFTSLPILWAEQPDLRDVLAKPAPPHWAKAVLARHGRIVAFDTLLDLSRVNVLVIAQPRPLAAEENVALDRWVRSGGRLLLFADPMLTEESAFPLGDRRRPQDVVLLSPILARWGLELRFDEAQPDGVREIAGEALAVHLAGQWAATIGGADSHCRIGADALVARCAIGKGRAMLVADAAVLEAQGSGNARAEKLDAMIAEAFGS